MMDYLIVGQGLAGTALAWHFRWRGVAFRIIDRDDVVTASNIAAGLITPITGKRFALEGTFQTDCAIASAFYRRVENDAGTNCFHRTSAVRILTDDAERERITRKSGIAGHLESVAIDNAFVRVPFGAFAMRHAARLDVPAYLAASRRAFERGGQFRIGAFPRSSTATVIDCTGIAALREHRLAAELFQPAKGEILTLHIPGLHENRVLHRGIWLARIGGDVYRAGATYSWGVLDDVPTADGRAELVRRVEEMLNVPFEVIGHDAATRPIARDRQPIIAQLAAHRWAFNGLGSKGALLAPRLARDLLARLLP